MLGRTVTLQQFNEHKSYIYTQSDKAQRHIKVQFVIETCPQYIGAMGTRMSTCREILGHCDQSDYL